jgi:hypothetical protein
VRSFSIYPARMLAQNLIEQYLAATTNGIVKSTNRKKDARNVFAFDSRPE